MRHFIEYLASKDEIRISLHFNRRELSENHVGEKAHVWISDFGLLPLQPCFTILSLFHFCFITTYISIYILFLFSNIVVFILLNLIYHGHAQSSGHHVFLLFGRKQQFFLSHPILVSHTTYIFLCFFFNYFYLFIFIFLLYVFYIF